MDLLGGYGSSDEEQMEQPEGAGREERAQPTPQAAPLPSAAVPLAAVPPAAGLKRPTPNVRGPLPNPLAPASKVQRSSASPAGAAASGVGARGVGAQGFIPPQLRSGRSNISTEDVGSYFVKGALVLQKQQQKGKQQQQQKGQQQGAQPHRREEGT